MYQKLLEEIYAEIQPEIGKGKVADYIPALKNADPKQFGISVCNINQEVTSLGDAQQRFSIQSISKVFTLTMAFQVLGDKLWERVGKEPSGNPFNSLIQLERENGIPRNPFINAGALVITDILISLLDNPKQDLLSFLKELCNCSNIHFDPVIAQSEKEHGFTNAALVNYMKSHGNIKNDVEEVLDLYFHQCSILMNCEQLAKSFLFLANHGVIPHSNQRVLTRSQAKRLNAIMLSCGLYDQAGDFAYLVGLPGKSGVAGGISAIMPEQMSITVWSPALNRHGNSHAGMKALELFTTKTGISIF
ncbi:glutaminase [Prolixibacteraceae bacterium JC049]|nr:glutaminase [Prolixibacteraceae bacterium JC049]